MNLADVVIAGLGVLIGALLTYGFTQPPPRPTLRFCRCGKITHVIVSSDLNPIIEQVPEPCTHQEKP